MQRKLFKNISYGNWWRTLKHPRSGFKIKIITGPAVYRCHEGEPETEEDERGAHRTLQEEGEESHSQKQQREPGAHGRDLNYLIILKYTHFLIISIIWLEAGLYFSIIIFVLMLFNFFNIWHKMRMNLDLWRLIEIDIPQFLFFLKIFVPLEMIIFQVLLSTNLFLVLINDCVVLFNDQLNVTILNIS